MPLIHEANVSIIYLHDKELEQPLTPRQLPRIYGAWRSFRTAHDSDTWSQWIAFIYLGNHPGACLD